MKFTRRTRPVVQPAITGFMTSYYCAAADIYCHVFASSPPPASNFSILINIYCEQKALDSVQKAARAGNGQRFLVQAFSLYGSLSAEWKLQAPLTIKLFHLL